MEKVEKETNKIIEKLSKSEENIKEKLNLPPYHFIELCIIFINYCDELTISKDDFLIAHSQITQDEEDEDASNDEFCTKIFNLISNNKPSAPIYALFAYLKSISITDKINTEILFKILDREEKGNIEFDNVETLISNLEEYLDIKEDWNDFIESYKGKKLTMRNLSQGDFINRISNLFDLASKKIAELTKKSVDKFCEDEKPENNNKNINNANNKSKKSNNSKEEDKKSKSKNSIKNNSDNSSSNVSSSKLFSKKSEKNIENEIKEIEKNNDFKQKIYKNKVNSNIENFKLNEIKLIYNILCKDENKLNFKALNENNIPKHIIERVIKPTCLMINNKNLEFNFQNFYLICKEFLDKFF
jgi:hypothetical protein